MDVANRLQQLPIARDGNAPESTLKYGAHVPRLLVEGARIRRAQRMHRMAQPTIGVIEEQMNMVAHKAPRDDGDAVALGLLAQQFQEAKPIIVVLEEQLFPVSA